MSSFFRPLRPRSNTIDEAVKTGFDSVGGGISFTADSTKAGAVITRNVLHKGFSGIKATPKSLWGRLPDGETALLAFAVLAFMTGLVGMIVALSNDYTDDSTYNNLLGGSILLLVAGGSGLAIMIYGISMSFAYDRI